MKKRGNATFACTCAAQELYKSVIACGVVMQAGSIANKLANVFSRIQRHSCSGIPLADRPLIGIPRLTLDVTPRLAATRRPPQRPIRPARSTQADRSEIPIKRHRL